MAIFPIIPQLTMPNPAAAIPAPMTPPTMECVVDTGAPTQVAKLIQSAAANRADIITQMKILVSGIRLGSMMPLEMVCTTSPPAMKAPADSKMAAMTSAPTMVSDLAPNAGPTLLATSLAPMLSAM